MAKLPKAQTIPPGDWRPGDVVADIEVDYNRTRHALAADILYRADEHAWMGQQAEALRSRSWSRVDAANLAEFLDDMAKRDERELRSRLIVLVMHMLKAERQPEKLSDSWVNTIEREQDEIGQIVDAPSLARLAPDLLAEAWTVAVRRAARETKLPAASFPQSSPWTVQQALSYQPPEPAPHPAEPVGGKKRRGPRGKPTR